MLKIQWSLNILPHINSKSSRLILNSASNIVKYKLWLHFFCATRLHYPFTSVFIHRVPSNIPLFVYTLFCSSAVSKWELYTHLNWTHLDSWVLPQQCNYAMAEEDRRRTQHTQTRTLFMCSWRMEISIEVDPKTKTQTSVFRWKMRSTTSAASAHKNHMLSLCSENCIQINV